MSHLTEQGLLQYKTIELNGEIEAIFDASPALEKLDELLGANLSQQPTTKVSQNVLKDLVGNLSTGIRSPLTPF